MNMRSRIGLFLAAALVVGIVVVAAMPDPGEPTFMQGAVPGETSPAIVIGAAATASRPADILTLSYPEASLELDDGRVLIANAMGFTVEMVDGNEAHTVLAEREGPTDRLNMYTDLGRGDGGVVYVLDSLAAEILEFDPDTGVVSVLATAPEVESDYPDAYVWMSSIDVQGDRILATGTPVVPRSQTASYTVGESRLWLWSDGEWSSLYAATEVGEEGDQFRDAKLLADGDVVAIIGESFVRLRGGNLVAKAAIAATYGGGILPTDTGFLVGAHTSILEVSHDFESVTEVAFPIPIANVGHIARTSKGWLALTDTDRQIVATWDQASGMEGAITVLGNSERALKFVSLAEADGQLVALENATPRLLRYNPADGQVSLIAGSGRQGYDGPRRARDFSFQYPSGVAVREDGAMFVTEANYRIVKVEGGEVSVFAGDVHSGSPGEGALASASRFGSLRQMDFDADGNLYVADEGNHSVFKISPSGIVARVMGTGSEGTWEHGQPALDQPLSHPMGVLVRANGDLLIADAYNNTVVQVSGGIATCFAGSRSHVTYQGYGSYGGDGGPACEAHMNTPNSLAEDAEGNVYISDQFNNRVRVVRPDGTIETFAGGSQGFAPDGSMMNLPQAVEVVGNHLYVADTGNSIVWAFPLE